MFTKNTRAGVLLAGGISILFGCFVFILLLLMLGVLGGCAGSSPQNNDLPTKIVPAPQATLPANNTPQPTAAPSLPEKRLVSVEYPKSIRVGDGDIIKLMIEVDDHGRVTPTAEISGHQLKINPIEIPNLYDTHQILVEARLDLAGVDVHPQDSFTTLMLPGKPVVFYWSVTAQNEGNFRGTVWLFLNLDPKDGGKSTRLALLAQRVDIEATSLFGLGGNSARWLGLGGSALSFVFSIPFCETMISRLWKKLRRTPKLPRLSDLKSTAQRNTSPPNYDKGPSRPKSWVTNDEDNPPTNHFPPG